MEKLTATIEEVIAFIKAQPDDRKLDIVRGTIKPEEPDCCCIMAQFWMSRGIAEGYAACITGPTNFGIGYVIDDKLSSIFEIFLDDNPIVTESNYKEVKSRLLPQYQ